jgi:glycosyltransferase involved in cell wall biosynthesis
MVKALAQTGLVKRSPGKQSLVAQRSPQLNGQPVPQQLATPFLSVVVPAFNEAERLPQTLAVFLQYLRSLDYDWEIIVVDDGSTDRTADLVTAIAATHEANQHVTHDLTYNSRRTSNYEDNELANQSDSSNQNLSLSCLISDREAYLSDLSNSPASVLAVEDVEEFKRAAIGRIKLVKLPTNQGKGSAVRAGVLASKGEQVLFSDADGSTPLPELFKLQEQLARGFEIAIGTRRDQTLIRKRQPFYRTFLGEGFNWLAKLTIGANIQDTQCGFKLIDGDLCRELFAQMQIPGFGFDVELLYLAKKGGYAIAQVPVVWHNDTRSKVNVFRDPILMFIDLIKIRLMH